MHRDCLITVFYALTLLFCQSLGVVWLGVYLCQVSFEQLVVLSVQGARLDVVEGNHLSEEPRSLSNKKPTCNN